jgi:Domain of unknown function (DUF4386)
MTDTTVQPPPSAPLVTATGRLGDTSPRAAARIAGLAILAIAVLGLFANLAVRESLVDPDDAAATFDEIAGSESLFRAGIAAFVVVFVFDVVVSWAVYLALRPAGRTAAMLASGFRLVYAVVYGAAMGFLLVMVELVGDRPHLAAFEPGQREALVLLAHDGFNLTWLVALVAFGVHLALVGWILFSTGIAPKVVGATLMLAGAAYVTDTLLHITLSTYADFEDVLLAIVAVPAVVGELGLAVWLLLRGGAEAPES